MKDFRRDLDRLRERLLQRRHVALSRFGDGELTILQNRAIDLTHKGQGEFRFDPRESADQALREQLLAALRYRHVDHWIGIPCPCCAGSQTFRDAVQLAQQPPEQLTWANLLVNANYDAFRADVLPTFAQYPVYLVAHEAGRPEKLPFSIERFWPVGLDAWRERHDLIDELSDYCRTVRGGLFLFCAGPLSNLLVHRLHTLEPGNTYLNLGSTLDPDLFEQAGLTRGYLRGAATRRRYCVWGDDQAPQDSPPRTSFSREPSKRPSNGVAASAEPVESDRHAGRVTVILTVYRRPQYLRQQVEAIRRQTVTPEAIWAWVNAPDPNVRSAVEEAHLDRVVLCSENARFHSRFALALLAPTEFVALFDDDTIPGDEWLANCLETFAVSPGILGAAGVRLETDAYRGRSLWGWHRPSNESTQVDLVGHAWFLPTAWIHYLFAERPVTGTNGEDIELAARAWRFGRIASYCPPHPPHRPQRWGSTLGDSLGSDASAASRSASHLDERDRIVRTEIAAGWQPLLARQSVQHNPPVPAAVLTNGHQEQRDSSSNCAIASTPILVNAAERQLIGLIPPEARRILLVGCGSGRLGAQLRNAGQRVIVGIEEDPRLAARAERRLDRVVLGTFDTCSESLAGETFDCIVIGRTLQHCREPVRFLEQVSPLLAENGTLVGLTANQRHHRTLHRLLVGAGAAGSSAARLYTRRELEKTLFRAALQPLTLQLATNGQDSPESTASEVQVGGLHISGLAPADAEEFHATDLLFAATSRQRPDYGLTSIIVLTHNELPYTHQCVESIRYRTDLPYELIFVDNGSTDGTVEYLRAIPGAKLIANAENRGFPAGVNQGLTVATGKQVLLLNNDTLVTTGWLERLLAALYSQNNIGLVGPCSNHVGSEQQISVSYTDLTSLDGFAWELAKSQRGQHVDSSRLVGFCLLIRREVVKQLGPFDERFGQGMFEDDDYCRRATGAGWRSVIALDAFVHHFGSRTFAASQTDFAGLLERNRRLFDDKWRTLERQSPGASLGAPKYRLQRGADGCLLLALTQPALSLVMIVRNNESTIRPCLESIKPWVDEMVVVDTGSQDATPTIARELGARVFEFPWCDDFSAARNESLRHARGEWVFWMDSDDTISPQNGRALRELALAPQDASILGHVMQVHCPGLGDADITAVDHLKLFRNRPELRFEGRIHEQIIPAIRRLGGEVAWTDLFVTHSGSDQSEEGRRRKHERDLRILRLDLAERPDHPFVLFNLGMTYADMDQPQLAIPYLQRSVAVAQPDESHLRKAYALLVAALSQASRVEEAWSTCERALEQFPQDAELRFRHGLLAHQRGDLPLAVRDYLDVLEGREKRHFSSLDRGIQGYKARQNLALVYGEMGKCDLAEEQWRRVIAETPSQRDAWRALGDVLLRQDKLDEAGRVVERLMGRAELQGEALMLLAQIAKIAQDTPRARDCLAHAVQEYPDDLDAHRAYCQLLYESDDLVSARESLEALVERDPSDASSLHNLGTVYLRLGLHELAGDVLQRSVALRPTSVPTLYQLGHVLRQEQRISEARQIWRDALRYAPDDPMLRQSLEELETQLELQGSQSG